MTRINFWHYKVLRKRWLMAIMVTHLFWGLDAQNCNLPNIMPSNMAELEAFNANIAFCFAPHVHHLVSGPDPEHGLNGLGDLMTSVFYDGNISTHDNWDNLENYVNNPNDQAALLPVVYYSVVWSESYWYIIYAFYHPRDFALDIDVSETLSCHALDAHHSDMEGVILKVKRPEEGEPAMVVASKTGCHHGYDERPFMTEWGTSVSANFENGSHIVVTVDNATHCVKHDYLSEIVDGINPCEPPAYDYIDYEPVWNNPSINLEAHTGQYILEDIHKPGGLWAKRNNENVFSSWGKFPNTINSVHAKAPWAWVGSGTVTNDPQLFFATICNDPSTYLINQYLSDEIPLEESPCVPPQDLVPETISISVFATEGQDLNINLAHYNEALQSYHVYFAQPPTWGTQIQGNILTINDVAEGNYSYEMEVVTPCQIESFVLKIKVSFQDGPWYPHGLNGPPKFRISPNPVNEMLQIEFINPSEDDSYEYFIFTEEGVLLDSAQREINNRQINIDFLTSDQYYLTINTTSFISTQSFIKI